MVDLGNHNAMPHLASNTHGDTTNIKHMGIQPTNMKCVESMYGKSPRKKMA
jgi:hypothetical protein